MYRDGHPNAMAKAVNALTALVHSTGISRDYLVTLEVIGRKSGKAVSFPLAMTVVDGERYLVSMLGPSANWVRNLKAAGCQATLRHGITEHIRLHEVAVTVRPPILKAYLGVAPGARPHIPVSMDAPLAEFEAVAADYPVFRVEVIHNEP